MKHSAKIRMSIMLLLLAAGYVMNAQDTRSSQPLNNVLTLNPAMMALSNDLSLSLDYRNQWATIDKGYITYAGALMCPLYFTGKGDSSRRDYWKSRLDFGLNITDDKSGGFNRTDATISVAYTLKLNPANSVTAALNLGYIHYTFDVASQSFDEQYQFGAYNPSLPTNENLGGKKGAPDVGVGFMYYFQPEAGKLQAFGGISAYHVNQPNMSLDYGNGSLPAKFDFQAGVKIIGNRLDFTPVVLYDMQGPFNQFIGGLLMDYKFGRTFKLDVGAWYKQSDAVVLQAGFQYKPISFAYSYDFGISQLARTTTGLMTHEITLAFKLYELSSKKGIKSQSFL